MPVPARPRPAAGGLDARVALALATDYLVWGTTYLAIRFALSSFAPFWQMASRFAVAGGLLLAWLALRRTPWPSARQWRDATLVGAPMLGGGMGLVATGAAAGEPWTMPWDARPRALAAWLYLVVAGSLLAFSAYMFLMARVRPALAGSYAYVNPAVALFVGAWLGGESVAPQTLVALPVILAGVAILMGGKR